MAEKMRFAVIGCGMLARSLHIPNIAASPQTVLHTCCDLDDGALAECRDRLWRAAHYQGLRQAINDPEVQAICIATTEELRLPLIARPRQRGQAGVCAKSR